MYQITTQVPASSSGVLTQISEFGTRISPEVPPRQYYFALWIQITIITCLLVLSGLFSDLNLGLMSRTPQKLVLIQKSGSKAKRQYAEVILPIRARGNLLFCSLLTGNVCVNSGISVLLVDLTSGYVALIASSAGIVVFGGIFPQSLCVKKDLAVGAYTIWVTRFSMIATFPTTYPISKNVFMLRNATVLNTKAVAEILRMGYTRIPVFCGDRNNVISLLFVKDLALLCAGDNFTIQTVCGYHQHPLRFVMEDTPLRVMLEEFNKAKIVDETDAVMDNVNRTRRRGAQARDVSCLMDAEEPSLVISVQMQLVGMQWLNTYQKDFHSYRISQSVIEKLIRQHCHRLRNLLIMEDKSTQEMKLSEASDLLRAAEEVKRKLLMRDVELRKANNGLVTWKKQFIEADNELNASAELHEYEKGAMASYESAVEVLNEMFRNERAN